MSQKPGQSSTPPNTRIYAVGDVHGHINLPKKLHSKINADAILLKACDQKLGLMDAISNDRKQGKVRYLIQSEILCNSVCSILRVAMKTATTQHVWPAIRYSVF